MLTNDGSGGFVTAASPAVGNRPYGVAAADLNGDGKLDLISADAVAGTLTVLTNSGPAVFVAATTNTVGGTPLAVTAADLNRDGWADLVCANNGASALTVLTNNGHGGFVAASTNGVGTGPWSVVAADVNGDGRLDLISASAADNTLTVLLATPPAYQTAFVGSGTGLTALNASSLSTGTIADARLSANPTFAGTVTAGGFAGSGSGLTALNASSLSTGTLSDTRLSPTVASAVNAANAATNANVANTIVRRDSSGSFAGGFTWQVVSGTAQQAQPNTGYLVTNNALVTVTLPPAATIGDTLRVSGIGLGGWRIAQNIGQSVLLATGLPGNPMTASWTARGSIQFWQSIASSADGTKLAAVVSQGRIYTSTDAGVTWTAQATADSGNWKSIASSADGTKLAAVVENGQIYTSTDSGVNWTPRESSRRWWSVASSADGSKLVAVDSQPGQIYTSTDSGVTWMARESNRYWTSIASSADGMKLVAGVDGGRIYTSTDSGVTWTAQPVGNDFWISIASSADGTKLAVAVCGPDGEVIYTFASQTLTGTAGNLLGSQNAALELQYIGNGQFLPLSYVGTIQPY